MSINDKVLDKLKKILSLANCSGATESEMQSAMAKAQSLAMEHNVDLASIVLSDGKAPEIDTERADIVSKTSDRRRPHHVYLSGILQKCFHVSTVYYGEHSSRLTLIGEKTDVAIARYVFDYLDIMFPKLHRQWCHDSGINGTYEDTTVRRRSYYVGLHHGICLANARKEDAVKSVDSSSYALVLKSKEDAVKARLLVEFPALKHSKIRDRRNDSTALQAGFVKGRDIKLNINNALSA